MTSRGIEVDDVEHDGYPEDIDSLNPWRFGLVLDPDPGHEDMRGRLAIPYLVPRGPGPVGLKFRCLGKHNCSELNHAKYLSLPGMGRRLFGVSALQTDSPVIVITEGELDAVVLNQVGIPAVAVPGVKNWAEEWAYLFEGFDRVFVLGDGDDEGRKFADKVAHDIEGATPAPMPTGYDVTEFVLERGVDEVRERLGFR